MQIILSSVFVFFWLNTTHIPVMLVHMLIFFKILGQSFIVFVNWNFGHDNLRQRPIKVVHNILIFDHCFIRWIWLTFLVILNYVKNYIKKIVYKLKCLDELVFLVIRSQHIIFFIILIVMVGIPHQIRHLIAGSFRTKGIAEVWRRSLRVFIESSLMLISSFHTIHLLLLFKPSFIVRHENTGHKFNMNDVATKVVYEMAEVRRIENSIFKLEAQLDIQFSIKVVHVHHVEVANNFWNYLDNYFKVILGCLAQPVFLEVQGYLRLVRKFVV